MMPINSFTSDIVTAGICKKEVFVTIPTENSVRVNLQAPGACGGFILTPDTGTMFTERNITMKKQFLTKMSWKSPLYLVPSHFIPSEIYHRFAH